MGKTIKCNREGRRRALRTRRRPLNGAKGTNDEEVVTDRRSSESRVEVEGGI
jgi:hypothetical protein